MVVKGCTATVTDQRRKPVAVTDVNIAARQACQNDAARAIDTAWADQTMASVVAEFGIESNHSGG